MTVEDEARMHRDICQLNLAKIDGAKQQWALENNQPGGAMPTASDLYGEMLYIRRTPVCPSGGTYTIGRVDTEPSCSMSTKAEFPHTFPK